MDSLKTANNDFSAEFAGTATDRDALPSSALIVINIDVNAAVVTAAKAEGSLIAMREQVAKLGLIDMTEYDKITTYARALAWAQASYTSASAPREGFFDVVSRASKLREILLAEVKALIARDVTDRRPLESIKGGTGFTSIGSDLSTLVAVVRAHPDEVAAKTMKLVDEAQKISQELIWQAPKRGSDATAVGVASNERQRAFTLFVHAYNEARRGISFVRWNEGDADALVPSLYAGRGGRSAKSTTEPPPPPSAGTGSPDTGIAAARTTVPAIPIAPPNGSPVNEG